MLRVNDIGLDVIQFNAVGVTPDIGGVTFESEFDDTSNNRVNAIVIVGAVKEPGSLIYL